MAGWDTNAYVPGPPPSPSWSPAVAASSSPASYNATISSHGLPITTDRDYTVVAGGITQPGPGQYVFDFGASALFSCSRLVDPSLHLTFMHMCLLLPEF